LVADTVFERRNKLLEDVAGEDDLGVVLRSHLWVEYELGEFITASLVNPKALRQSMDYADKVRLALALGLERSLERPLNTIGTIRNRFAHKLGEKIAKSDVDSLYKSFPTTMKDAVQKGRQDTKKILGPMHPSINETSVPRVQYALCAISLWAALASVHRRLM
jgi:hypothetical protein